MTLPNFSSFSPFSDPEEKPDLHTYHERKIFPYRRNQLYSVVADVASYPGFVPFCSGSKILQRHVGANEIVTMDAELTVGFLALTESYVSKVTCRPYESVEAVASSSTPLFKTLTTIWRFQPASPRSPHSTTGQLPQPSVQQASTTQKQNEEESGPTLVTLDLSFAFSNPVHATVSAAFFGQVSKLMVRAFEERCMQVYGRGGE